MTRRSRTLIPIGLLAVSLAATALAQTAAPPRIQPAPGSRSSALSPSGRPAAQEILQLNADLSDSAKAFEAVKRAKRYLRNNPDSAFRVFLHRGIINGLIIGNAPGYMVVEAADSALKVFKEPLPRAIINGEVAQHLINHGDLRPRALKMARTALLELPKDPRFEQFRGFALGTLGEAYLLNDRPDSAIMVLTHALPLSPDSQRVLRHLGVAHEAVKKEEQAIQFYLRSAGVFMGPDSSAVHSLRALWIKRKGSDKGLAEALAASRHASRRLIALDSRRFEKEAPNWTLPDLDGKNYQLADHRGKVVVLDFWGTWCGPCRQELPIFQKVYNAYQNKDVVFYGVNWERVGVGADPRQIVREFMTKHSYNFPVVLDHERIASTAYEIDAFPTVYLIDKKGQIRYRNIGLAEGIEHILTAQIESLLD